MEQESEFQKEDTAKAKAKNDKFVKPSRTANKYKPTQKRASPPKPRRQTSKTQPIRGSNVKKKQTPRSSNSSRFSSRASSRGSNKSDISLDCSNAPNSNKRNRRSNKPVTKSASQRRREYIESMKNKPTEKRRANRRSNTSSNSSSQQSSSRQSRFSSKPKAKPKIRNTAVAPSTKKVNVPVKRADPVEIETDNKHNSPDLRQPTTYHGPVKNNIPNKSSRAKPAASGLARGSELGANITSTFNKKASSMNDYLAREKIRRQQRGSGRAPNTRTQKETVSTSGYGYASSGSKPKKPIRKDELPKQTRLQMRKDIQIEDRAIGGTQHNKPKDSQDLSNKRAAYFESLMNKPQEV